MLYIKFQGHQPLGSDEGDFWRIFPSKDLEAILVMWPPNIWINFHPNIPWRLHMNFGFKWPNVFLRKKKYENVESERPWTKVSEGHWSWVVINCHVLIYLTICTNFHLTGFNSFLEIFSLSIFPYKNKSTKFDLAVKLGHHLNKFGSTLVTNAALYQVSRSSAFWFQRRWAWWPSWSCDINHLYSLSPFIPWRPHMKFGFNRPSGF